MTENKMTHDEAWVAFRRGDLEKISFIPGVEEMHKKFNQRIRNSCCSRKRTITQNFNKRLIDRMDAKE